MLFGHKKLTEKYTKILQNESSEPASKDSLYKIFDNISLPIKEIYKAVLEELLAQETQEAFLNKIKVLHDIIRTNWSAVAFTYRNLIYDAEDLGYPKLGDAIDTALTYIHHHGKDNPERFDKNLAGIRLKRFEAAFLQSQEEKRAKEAQRQHTNIHGVDLTNL